MSSPVDEILRPMHVGMVKDVMFEEFDYSAILEFHSIISI